MVESMSTTRRLVARTRPERPGGAQGLADHPLELTDVAEGERAQEGPERRGRHHPVLEHLGARSGAQHVGVVDVAGPGHHGMDERQDLASRPEPADAPRQVDGGVTELLEPEPLGQGGDEHQPGVGHQVRLVEGHRDPVDSARYWLHRKCLLCGRELRRRAPQFSQHRGHFPRMRACQITWLRGGSLSPSPEGAFLVQAPDALKCRSISLA